MAGDAYRAGEEPVPGYRLISFLGRGGFGQVWKAEGPGGIEVALKFIDDLGRKRGGKEMRALHLLKGIRHPNLLPIIAFWRKDAEGKIVDDLHAEPVAGGDVNARETLMVDVSASRPKELIIAMTLAERSLYERMEECRNQGLQGIPHHELLEYLQDAAKAIDYLNTHHQIQHCDIKPQNILIQGGVSQVCDFGLARAIGDVRRTSMTAGTVAYGAPELFSGSGHPAATTDQYSLAISYYELVTGELPFAEESFRAVMEAKSIGGLVFSRVTEPERQVLERATSIDPQQRYRSSGSLVRALIRCSPITDPTGSQSRFPPVRIATPSDDMADIAPGYRRVQLLGREGDIEMWNAVAPDGQQRLLMIETLNGERGDLDYRVLSSLSEIHHDNLLTPERIWLISSEGNIQCEGPPLAEPDSPPRRIVAAYPPCEASLETRMYARRSESGSGLPVDELLAYCQQAAAAIDSLAQGEQKLHGAKTPLAHTSIRASYMMVDRLGHVRLAQTSRMATIGSNDPPQKRRPAHWRAPELVAGSATSRSDQYSLAFAYCELRSGQLLTASAPQLQLLPQAEAEVIERALSSEPAKRYPTCSGFVEALIHATGVKPALPPASSAVTWQGFNSSTVGRSTPFENPLAATAVVALADSGVTDHLKQTSGPSTMDTRASDARSSDAQPWPGQPGAALPKSRMPLLVAGACFVPLLALFVAWNAAGRFERDVQRLFARNEYDEGMTRLEKVPAWYAWLVDEDELRELGKHRADNAPNENGAGGELLANWRKQIREATNAEKFDEAMKQLREPQANVAELLSPAVRNATEKEVLDAWIAAIKDRDEVGERPLAVTMNRALVVAFPNSVEAKDLLARLTTIPESVSKEEDDPNELNLTLAELQLEKAQGAFPTQPEKCIERLSDVTRRLSALGSIAKATEAQRSHAAELRYEALLARARVEASLSEPNWTTVRDHLGAVTLVVEQGATPTPSQAALLAVLRVLEHQGAADADWEALANAKKMPELLAEATKALAEPGEKDWYWPNASEIEREAKAGGEWTSRLRQYIAAAHDDPEKGVALCDELLTITPNDSFALAAKAEFLARLEDYDRAQEAIIPAIAAAPADKSAGLTLLQRAIGSLRKLARAAEDQASSATLKKELAQLSKDVVTIGASDATLGDSLRRQYAELAVQNLQRDSTLRDQEVLDPLGEAIQSLALTADDPLAQDYGNLIKLNSAELEMQLSTRRKEALDAIEKEMRKAEKPDFAKLRQKLDAARQSGAQGGLIDLATAEELIETKDDLLSTRQWENALKLASVGNVKTEDLPYQRYLQATVKYVDPSGTGKRDAAVQLAALYSQPIPVNLQGFRQQYTANMLRKAAQQLEVAKPSIGAWEAVFQSPYANLADAATADSWLTLAQKLDPLADGDGFQSDALAAFWKEPRDKEQARIAALRAIDESAKPTRATAPMNYILAATSAEKAPAAALGNYKQLVDLAESDSGDENGLAPLQFDEWLLTPAIQIAHKLAAENKLSASDKQSAAELYAKAGSLRREHPFESWPGDDPKTETIDLYEKAIALDGAKAAYFYGRGDARLRAQPNQLVSVKADAQKAIALDPKLSGGHALLGETLLREARTMPKLAERPAVLAKAVESLDQAIALAPKGDPQKAYYLTNRSMCRLEWANFIVDETHEDQRKLLKLAKDDAAQAVELHSAYQDYACRALGNALEDLSWIGGQTENYPAAVEAFGAAIEARGDIAAGWLDRGRCRFKMVHYAGADKAILADAIRDLKTAIDREPNGAEAHYWLGLSFEEQGNKSEAETALKKAVSLEPDLHAASWELGRLAAAKGDMANADAYFANAIRSAAKTLAPQEGTYLTDWLRTIEPYPPVAPAMKARSPALAKAASSLIDDATPEAVAFRGKVAALEGRWPDAIAIYDLGLKAPPKSGDQAAQLYLGRSAARYFSPDVAADLKLGDQSKTLQDADAAVAQAKDPAIKALAYSQAAQARLKAVKDVDNAAVRKRAVEDLRQAVALQPNDPQGWGWRFLLVQNWLASDPSAKNDPAKKAQMKKYLDDAYNAAPASYKTTIGRLKAGL